MRDAEGHQRLPLKTGGRGRPRGKQGIAVHIVMDPETYARVQQLDLAEDNRSLSRTIGHLVRDALSDDSITGEEGRLILRGLNALMAEESMPEDVMDQVEKLTEKIQRAYPELR